MMVTATLTSKGQVTIPARVREVLGVSQGDKLEFEEADGGFLIRASIKRVSRLAGFFGPHQGAPVTIEQLNDDIAAEASR
ncbi:MAG: AbrB/MazE/SpoVT family DNA-binding domain-containing protein [Propionibacteriaceae bacterium]|jgi:AbrB family looped-hinge helix DNA binding protein|nr:AbrB/MazE/SpoVT family DNA-binding domain-containing protein [Propionibacteriaceae bacterium]